MVGAPLRRPSADHSRAGTSTASILAGPAVSRRRSSPRPRSPHCCRCCVGVALPLLLFLGPSLECSLLSLSLSFARSFSLSPFSRACLLLTRVLSFSLSLSLSSARSPSLSFLCAHSLFLARSLAVSLSLSCALSARALSLSLSRYLALSLSLAAAQGPPTSPAVQCLALRTQCHRSAPSAGHRSASRRVRRAASRRFPAPRGIHPP